MQRSTSFFWASDDLRDSGEDHGDDYLEVGDEENLLLNGGNNTGMGWPIDEGEGSDEDFYDEEHKQEVLLPLTDERVTLNGNPERNAPNGNSNGYGSSFLHNFDIENGGGWSVPPNADSAVSVETLTNGEQIGRRWSVDPVAPVNRRRLFNHMPMTNKGRGDDHSARITAKNVPRKSIRFQVVIWHIGTIDVQTGHVKMRFRLTLFWNDGTPGNKTTNGATNSTTDCDDDVWVMEGRQRAYRKKWRGEGGSSSSTVEEVIDVPPVSILNAVELEIVDDAPEITMVDKQTRSMRWTIRPKQCRPRCGPACFGVIGFGPK